jgi:hypothetical protein
LIRDDETRKKKAKEVIIEAGCVIVIRPVETNYLYLPTYLPTNRPFGSIVGIRMSSSTHSYVGGYAYVIGRYITIS